MAMEKKKGRNSHYFAGIGGTLQVVLGNVV